MRAGHKAERIGGLHRHERHPNGAGVVTRDRPIGLVLMPGSLELRAGRPHEHGVEKEVDSRRAQESPCDFGCGRLEDKALILSNVVPRHAVPEHGATLGVAVPYAGPLRGRFEVFLKTVGE